MLKSDDIKRLLGLEPLEPEGGFFAETYRSARSVPAEPAGTSGRERPLATAIYYLLTPERFSSLHRLPSDEVYHFYLGDPVEILLLREGGEGESLYLGPDLTAGMRPQLVVPAGTWQGSRLRKGGSLALMGTTVSPGFEASDFEAGKRSELVRAFPRYRDMIESLCPG
jgi:hypothetical protein